MTSKGFLLFFGMILIPFIHNANFACASTPIQAVTYETTNGRFGDNLMCYFHAKWISYKYNIPLLYQPFIYSDQLTVDDDEMPYDSIYDNHFEETVFLGKNAQVDISKKTPTLYFSPYFPESRWELKNCISYDGGPWDYFEVDWNDRGYINFLKQSITPKVAIPKYDIPEDRISIAVHVRRGGSYDDLPGILGFPLKFLPDIFFLSQIRNVYNMLDKTPLYVFIFTDDLYPKKILKKFKRHLADCNIEFDCRKTTNNDFTNVIEDFFSLLQFDCLIHSESNFSLCASKIGDYLVSIYPDSFCVAKSGIYYDHTNIHSQITSDNVQEIIKQRLTQRRKKLTIPFTENVLITTPDVDIHQY